MKIIIVLATFFLLGACGKTENAASQRSTADAMAQGTVKPKNPYYSRTDTIPLHIDEVEWKKVLSDSVYEVARNKDTERAFTGKYWNYDGIGTYYCAACGNKLFRSEGKFASNCGWPSFFEPARKNAVIYEDDNSFGMERIEVLCGRCRGHLGHLFDDGPPPTGKRYCMNSIVLDFVPELKL